MWRVRVLLVSSEEAERILAAGGVEGAEGSRLAPELAKRLDALFRAFLTGYWFELKDRGRTLPLDSFIDGRSRDDPAFGKPIGRDSEAARDARGRRKPGKRGRRKEKSTEDLVGNLLGCVLDFLGRGFGTSVGGQGKKNAGHAGGPVLRFLFTACDTLRVKLEAGEVEYGSPELSAAAAERLKRLTKAALRKRVQPLWSQLLRASRDP
jgi:hypothetical protein